MERNIARKETQLSRDCSGNYIGLDGIYFTLFIKENIFRKWDIAFIGNRQVYFSQDAKPADDKDFAYEECQLVTNRMDYYLDNEFLRKDTPIYYEYQYE